MTFGPILETWICLLDALQKRFQTYFPKWWFLMVMNTMVETSKNPTKNHLKQIQNYPLYWLFYKGPYNGLYDGPHITVNWVIFPNLHPDFALPETSEAKSSTSTASAIPSPWNQLRATFKKLPNDLPLKYCLVNQRC